MTMSKIETQVHVAPSRYSVGTVQAATENLRGINVPLRSDSVLEVLQDDNPMRGADSGHEPGKRHDFNVFTTECRYARRYLELMPEHHT